MLEMGSFENKRICVYPSIDAMTILKNPYINDFCENLENQGNIIVNKNPKGNHLFPLGLYINDADIFIFHWLENVPTYKRGFLQYIYAVVLLTVLKLFGKKIVWFCHNKKVHGLKNKIEEIQSNHLLCLLKRMSTHIFTHSKEGLEILEKFKDKSIYLMHPSKNRLNTHEFIKKYDLLIWGSISEYKGVLEFLLEIKSNLKLQCLKIKIIGKCMDDQLLDEIKEALSNNIDFENRPISFDDLKVLRSSVEFVLIPYKSDTVLGSAILMDSLSFGFSVIAPDIAAFRELKDETRVRVKAYSNISDIPSLIGKSNKILNYDSFLEEYKWSNFTRKMLNTISERKLSNQK